MRVKMILTKKLALPRITRIMKIKTIFRMIIIVKLIMEMMHVKMIFENK